MTRQQISVNNYYTVNYVNLHIRVYWIHWQYLEYADLFAKQVGKSWQILLQYALYSHSSVSLLQVHENTLIIYITLIT